MSGKLARGDRASQPFQEITMPSESKAQKRTMQAAEHDPKFAAKVGIPQKVAREFVAADKARGPAKLPARKGK